MASAQAPQSPPPTELLIDQLKKTVVFVEGNYESTEVQLIQGVPQPTRIPKALFGTGFFIYAAEPRFGKDRGFTWLVTNKHLVREPPSVGALELGPYLKEVSIRFNLKEAVTSGGLQYGVAPVQVLDERGYLQCIIDPDDDSVDLALFPLGLDPQRADFRTIQTDLFATREVLKKER